MCKNLKNIEKKSTEIINVMQRNCIFNMTHNTPLVPESPVQTANCTTN